VPRLTPDEDIGSSVDITDRRETERSLRECEERFRQMADNIDEAFWMTDVSKNEMLYVSSGYERIFGRSVEEIYASPVWLGIRPGIPDKGRQRNQQPINRVGWKVEDRRCGTA
jgi:PAS domain S-box-containing protein